MMPAVRAILGRSALVTILPLALAASLPVTTLGWSSTARAQDPSAEIKRLNKQALDAFDSLNFDQAKGFLDQALTLGESSGLAKSPLIAKTHLNFGMLWIAGFQKREEGVSHFKAALRIQPDIAPAPGFFNPETQAVFDETKANVRLEPPPVKAPPTPVASSRPRTAVIESGGGPKDSDEDDNDDDKGTAGVVGRGIWISLGVGSGFGTAKGQLETNQRLQPNNNWAGGVVASRLAHFSLAAGYFLSADLLLSLEGRLQIVTGTTTAPPIPTMGSAGTPGKSPPGSAIAVFAKGQWFLAPGPVRPFLVGGIGVGAIRQVVFLKKAGGVPLADCGSGTEECVDTIAGGPLLLAVGGGISYELGTFAVMASLTANVGVPKLMLNMDVLLGAGVHF